FPRPLPAPLFPYTTLFRSGDRGLQVFEPAVPGVAPGEFQTFRPRARSAPARVLVARLAERAGELLRRRREPERRPHRGGLPHRRDRESTRLNSSHDQISYA